MKIMFASDIHGSLYHTKRLLALFEEEQADLLVLLGDFLYHGPRNAVPNGYDPLAVATALNQYKHKILGIRGNCESEMDEMLLEFPIMAHNYLFLDGKRVFLTHGHVYNRTNLGVLQQGDILIHGHFHTPRYEEVNGVLVLSPGSVSLPKNWSPTAYMVYENGVFTIKDLEKNDITAKTKEQSK